MDRRSFIGKLTGATLSVVGAIGGGLAMVAGSESSACLRPPGALLEADFLATCIRCGRCADACPNRCIVGFTEDAGSELDVKPGLGQRNTPVIFPRKQACILCNGAPGEDLLCTSACPTGALVKTKKDPDVLQATVKMGTAEVDTTLCYSFNGASCGACIRACPFEGTALRAGLWEKPLVDPEACVGCGLCERACVHYPQAIRILPA